MDISYILDNYQQHEQHLKNRFMDTKVLSDVKEIHETYVKVLFIDEQLRKLGNQISGASKKNHKSNSSLFNTVQLTLDKITEDIEDDTLFEAENNMTVEQCLKFIDYDFSNVPMAKLIQIGKKIKQKILLQT
jgi:seryl-tRNA synthetase